MKSLGGVMKLEGREREMLLSAAREVWGVIAYDCMELAGGRMSRAEVIEMVLDANRLEGLLEQKLEKDEPFVYGALMWLKEALKTKGKAERVLREVFKASFYVY